MFEYVVQFMAVTTIGVLAVTSPGPDFLVVVRNTMSFSKRAGVWTAVGISMGTTFWILMSLIGVSLILSQAAVVYTTLKLVGAIYLVYLGVQSLRSASSVGSTLENIERSHRHMGALRAFVIGLLTNVFNPKVGVFFLTFFSSVLGPETSISLKVFYGIEVSVIALVWFTCVARFLSISYVRNVFEKCRKWFDAVTGTALVGIGLGTALSEAR